MMKLNNVGNRPVVLTIAGFDPSGGAGLLADIKTIEQLGGYGIAVQTANTIQTDTNMLACHWTSAKVIEQQMKALMERFSIDVVKIGVVESAEILHSILFLLKEDNPDVRIILDPVLTSSSAYDFHEKNQQEHDFCSLLNEVDLLTPNITELAKLYPQKEQQEAINSVLKQTNLLLKGGHSPKNKGLDRLFMKEGKIVDILPGDCTCYEKHGSGCVLSSAIATFMALGYSMEESCEKGKKYVEHFLYSTVLLLGLHANTNG